MRELRAMTAADKLAAALAIVPSLADHTVIPGSAATEARLAEAWALLQEAVSLDPACAPAHAARGNVLVRAGNTLPARRSYALAARIDPHDAASRLALGELAIMAGDDAEGAMWLAEAFALARQFAPAARPGSRTVLVLSVAGPWHRNIPLDFIVDPARWTLHRWYVPDPRSGTAAFRLPAYDVAIDAIGESAVADEALDAAEQFAATQTQPFLNDPARVFGTARDALATTLRGVAGVRAAPIRRVTREELLRLTFEGPHIVRPADLHGGNGLERLDAPGALRDYVTRNQAAEYDIGPFVDFRSADGYFRKYRVMFVGGEPYPYHLAIDTQWLIHYRTAPMAEHAWMRDEERRFLTDPASAFPDWLARMRAIAAALGLDYAGIDCTLLSDGTIFVFEADAAMLVHGFDPDPTKRAAYRAICDAFDRLLTGAIGAVPRLRSE
jgi:tetratricopeptide (TPR) repeat protein